MPELARKIEQPLETEEQREKWTYRLMLVGKHEALDEKSLEGIDDRLAKAENEEKRERLRRIKDAYSKLTT